MPEPLSGFVSGREVELVCYQGGCEEVFLSVRLGENYSPLHPSFKKRGGVGRLNWDPEAPTLVLRPILACLVLVARECMRT